MEQVRDQTLDNRCESLGDVREEMAKLRANEAEILKGALKRMSSSNINSYRHAKIELLRSPGEERIRARLVKDHGGMAEEETEDQENTETL